MKQIQAGLYFVGTFALPLIALAHGDIPDGHEGGATAVANPEQRMKVLAGVVVVVVLLVGFMWYAHRKNIPKPPLNQK